MVKHLDHWFPKKINVNAITFGKHVFFAMKNPSERLLSHEQVHVNQYKKDGVIKFLTKYLYEYFKNRLNGMEKHQAYLNISYEIEAREKEIK